MKTLLSTLAAAICMLAMNSCTKAPMPAPERPLSAQQFSRVTDTTSPPKAIPGSRIPVGPLDTSTVNIPF